MVSAVKLAMERRKARWEGLCRQCGLCCYEKDVRGLEVVTNWRRPCRYLDLSTRQCTVYEKRFHVCPECHPMTLRHAMFVTWLPETCGYVRHYRARFRSPFRSRQGIPVQPGPRPRRA